MSLLKRRGRIGHRLNRFNSSPFPSAPVLAAARCVLLAACPSASRRLRLACLPFYHSLRSSVSSHPLILPALATPDRLALLNLPVFRVVGRGVLRLVLISSCVPPVASACLPAIMRSARPRLGMLYAILCVVAMGTVGCGAFVPRSRELHFLSMGVVRISSSARRPFFSTFAVPLFLPPRSSCR